MSKVLTIVGIVLFCCVTMRAGYIDDRKSAMKHISDGKNKEAAEMFVEIAASSDSDVQKSDALEQAVLCTIRLKQYENALKLAKQIPLLPISKASQMRILMQTRQWKEVTGKFGDDDIAKWPEKVRGKSYLARGRSFFFLKNGERAKADLENALKYITNTNSKCLVLNTLGATYHQLLKNDSKAIETYRLVNKHIYKKCQATMAVASILGKQGKFNEALKELNKIDVTKFNTLYKSIILIAYADIYAEMGESEKAIERYNEALKSDKINMRQKNKCEKALIKLKK